MKTSAIIVAAGKGRRLGGELPKQFQALGKMPVICHTLSKFEMAASIEDVVVVVGKDWMSFVESKILCGFEFSKVSQIVAGGNERQESVFLGLCALQQTDIVAVHDAVRPLVSPQLIDSAVAAAKSHRAAVVAVPPKDTMKKAVDGKAISTIDRQQLYCAQTPQVFEYQLLYDAHEQAQRRQASATDDSALVEKMGTAVKIVEGSYENIKITVPADLGIAEYLMSRG